VPDASNASQQRVRGKFAKTAPGERLPENERREIAELCAAIRASAGTANPARQALAGQIEFLMAQTRELERDCEQRGTLTTNGRLRTAARALLSRQQHLAKVLRLLGLGEQTSLSPADAIQQLQDAIKNASTPGTTR
jgi:hypothetical protein